MEAAVTPLPKPERTPPETNMYAGFLPGTPCSRTSNSALLNTWVQLSFRKSKNNRMIPYGAYFSLIVRSFTTGHSLR